MENERENIYQRQIVKDGEVVEEVVVNMKLFVKIICIKMVLRWLKITIYKYDKYIYINRNVE